MTGKSPRPPADPAWPATDDLDRFCCLNPDCDRYGDGGRRLLSCKACKKRFSERKGTPLFACRLDDDKARSVLAPLQEGGGVRQTGRRLGLHRDTVLRLGRLAGDHAQAAHDRLVSFSPLDDQAPTG